MKRGRRRGRGKEWRERGKERRNGGRGGRG